MLVSESLGGVAPYYKFFSLAEAQEELQNMRSELAAAEAGAQYGWFGGDWTTFVLLAGFHRSLADANFSLRALEMAVGQAEALGKNTKDEGER